MMCWGCKHAFCSHYFLITKQVSTCRPRKQLINPLAWNNNACLSCNELDTTHQNETVTLAITSGSKKNPKTFVLSPCSEVNCLGILVGLRMLKLRIHRAQRWKGKWYNKDPVFLICNSSWWAYVGNQLWLKASRIRLYLPCSLGPSGPVLLTAKPQPHISIQGYIGT